MVLNRNWEILVFVLEIFYFRNFNQRESELYKYNIYKNNIINNENKIYI